MNGPTHTLGGIALTSATVYFTGIYMPETISPASVISLGLFISGGATAALLLDIDKKGSTISNKHKILSFFLRLFMTHRGFTHSLLAYVIFSAIMYLGLMWVPEGLGHAFALGSIIGYGSHLLLDSFNPKGIPLFYPLKTRFSVMNIVTGSFSEYIVGALLMLSIIICWKNIGIDIYNLIKIKL